MAFAVLVVSVLRALTAGSIGNLLLLTPAVLWSGLGLLQPVTFAFIATDPLGVAFSCFLVWSMGGSLEQAWGARRFWLFGVGTAAAAGLLTALVARFPLVAPQLWEASLAGSGVLVSAIWLAEGWRLGQRQLGFFGMPVTGNQFALIGLGFIFLRAVFSGWQVAFPEAVAAGLTYLYVRGFGPRLLWLRFTSWRLQRRMRSRTRHLRLVDEGRNTPRDSDRFIH